MSKAKRTTGGGKVAAYSSHQSSSSASSSRTNTTDVSPTVTNMLLELQQLIKKTQVGVASPLLFITLLGRENER